MRAVNTCSAGHGWRLTGAPLAGALTVTIALALAAASAESKPVHADLPAPAHVPAWAYDDGCNGGAGASARLVQQWVTYAESNCGPEATKALDDCGSICTPVQYLDAGWIYAQGSAPIARAAAESWWQHEPGYDDAAHRISNDAYGGGSLLDQANPQVDQWFQDYVRADYANYPALMMDDMTATVSEELWGSNVTASAELPSDQALELSHEQFASYMTHADGSPFTQIDNALTPNPYLPPPFQMLGAPGAVTGLIAEGAPIYNGQMTAFYSTLLDELAYVDETSDDFAVLLSYAANGARRARLVQAATVLLAYDGSHVVSWPDLETSSPDLAVWPEQGIVGAGPVESMAGPAGAGCLSGNGTVCSSGGHNSLQVAPGVYRREFRGCSDRGQAFGVCAAIVNARSSPVTISPAWLQLAYRHELGLNGGDVQSGGSVNLAGSRFVAGRTVLGAHSAAILTP
jgi:hypothetical protein